MFSTVSSHRFCTTTAPTCAKRVSFLRPACAKAQRRSTSSSILKPWILAGQAALKPKESNKAGSHTPTCAKALRQLDSSCGRNSSAQRGSSEAKLWKTATSRTSAVAKDQAIMERQSPLNSPGSLRSKRWETAPKSSGHGKDNFANAQMSCDISKGWKSEMRGAATSLMAAKSCSSRIFMIEQAQAMTLMFCTCMPDWFFDLEPPLHALHGWFKIRLETILYNCSNAGSVVTQSTFLASLRVDSLPTRCMAVAKLMSFMSPR
mmetsp:Transcript_44549/g.127713  ORF Transcript_44549/g.127713 Transcript_44549/m.127713 type:complete len:262 (+) Transcript_44549:1578-2363(+)